MKYLKIIIPISILSLIFIIDYYNKYYKSNTSFESESIFLYVMKDDSIAFRDSISKYIKSEKTYPFHYYLKGVKQKDENGKPIIRECSKGYCLFHVNQTLLVEE